MKFKTNLNGRITCSKLNTNVNYPITCWKVKTRPKDTKNLFEVENISDMTQNVSRSRKLTKNDFL